MVIGYLKVIGKMSMVKVKVLLNRPELVQIRDDGGAPALSVCPTY